MDSIVIQANPEQLRARRDLDDVLADAGIDPDSLHDDEDIGRAT